MEQTKIREQVIDDLKQYPELKKKVILLRYEQEHPAKISDSEVIDSMALSRPVSEKQAEVIRKYYFEGKTWGELQREMHLAPRTLLKRRDDGLDALVSIYSYIGQVKGDRRNT